MVANLRGSLLGTPHAKDHLISWSKCLYWDPLAMEAGDNRFYGV